MAITRWHLGRRSVREEHLGWLPAFLAPGAVTAGTNIALPDYAKPAKRVADALLLKCSTVSATHAACGATGAAYPSATNIISPAGEAVVTEAKKLTVVKTAPATGQIQLVDENNVILGEDTSADDILLLIVERKP